MCVCMHGNPTASIVCVVQQCSVLAVPSPHPTPMHTMRPPQSLCLLHHLAADPLTQEPTLDVLRKCGDLFSGRVGAQLLGAPLPSDAPTRTLRLFQHAWLLRIAAVELHAADAAVVAHAHSMRGVMQHVFVPPLVDDGGVVAVQRSRVLELAAQCARPVQHPSLGAVGTARVRSVLAGLGLEGVLVAASPGQGVWVESDRGDVVLDLAALKDALLLKCVCVVRVCCSLLGVFC